MPSDAKVPSFYNGWLPSSKAVHRGFLKQIHGGIQGPYSRRAPHTPAVEKFAQAIRSNEVMMQLFNRIFMQQALVPEIECVRCSNPECH